MSGLRKRNMADDLAFTQRNKRQLEFTRQTQPIDNILIVAIGKRHWREGAFCQVVDCRVIVHFLWSDVDIHPVRKSKRRRCTLSTIGLNDREREIFEARRLREDPATLEELSEKHGVSRERIRQIEVRAFEKVQKAVQTTAREFERPVLR